MRTGTNHNSRRLVTIVIAATPLLLLLVSFSGCIQTHMLRDIVFEEEEKEIVYAVEQVLNMQQTFTESYNIDTYSTQENFEVREKALWLIITVELKLHIFYQSSIPVRADLENDDTRGLEIIITDPDGSVTTHVFQDSVIVNLDPILEPKPGLWMVRSESTGRGFSAGNFGEYYDTFSVTGKLNQPEK